MWQKYNQNAVAGALVGGIATDVQNCESNHRRLKQHSWTHRHSVSIKQRYQYVSVAGISTEMELCT